MSNVNGVFSGQFSAEMNGGGSGLLQYGLVDVTTAGSQVQLPNIPCREVTIIAKDSNNGFIYVGGQGISSINYGVKLKADGSITLPVNNANLIHINASVDGEGVSYVAL